MRKNFNIPILLDTSAFRSLSSDELKQYNLEKLKIMISPYTFWELLCHLDIDWIQYKGNIYKCSRVQILDDPRAIIETDLKYQTDKLINRLPDNELIPGILECLNKSNSINDFYNSNFITDNEYNPKREQLLADKVKIKENIDSYDTRIDDWLELTEKAFDFVSCAREAFINGDLETKRAILAAIGKNITLLDGKIHIEPEEWLVPIADEYPALEKQYKMFEPEKNTDFEHKNRILEPIRTAWLGREDSNR